MADNEQASIAFGFDTTADGTTVAVVARSGPGEPWHIECATAPAGVTEQQVRDWVAQYVCIDPEQARAPAPDLQSWKDVIAEWVEENADGWTFRLTEWQKSVLAYSLRGGVVAHPRFMSTPRKWSSMLSERARILELIDVDPWRLPEGGLLEYDPVHDEWRVEMWRWPAKNGTVVIRRYAGRRRPATHRGWRGDQPLGHGVWPTPTEWARASAGHRAARRGGRDA